MAASVERKREKERFRKEEKRKALNYSDTVQLKKNTIMKIENTKRLFSDQPIQKKIKIQEK